MNKRIRKLAALVLAAAALLAVFPSGAEVFVDQEKPLDWEER